MNGICLVLDRWHLGFVGAYGNAWIATPGLDRLAAESFVFDRYLIDSPRLDDLYRSFWQGRHALAGQPRRTAGRRSLPALWKRRGTRAVLLTDEPAVAAHPLARRFAKRLLLDVPRIDRPADRVDQTHLATCFAQLIDVAGSLKEPFFLWCHFSAFGSPWDAPLGLRQRYVEGDDPDPPTGVEVPSRVLTENEHPDVLLGQVHSYAAQVSLMDICLSALLDDLDTAAAGRETLLAVLSARGFALGEHRRVGPCDGALHGELVHVPLLVRMPDGLGAAGRSPALVQPPDLFATLADTWAADAPPLYGPPAVAGRSLAPLLRDETRALGDRAALVAPGGETALATPAWFLRRAERVELYAKPDDRFEVSDVSDRAPAVVEALETVWQEYHAHLLTGRPAELTPLDEVLLHGFA